MFNSSLIHHFQSLDEEQVAKYNDLQKRNKERETAADAQKEQLSDADEDSDDESSSEEAPNETKTVNNKEAKNDSDSDEVSHYTTTIGSLFGRLFLCDTVDSASSAMETIACPTDHFPTLYVFDGLSFDLIQSFQNLVHCFFFFFSPPLKFYLFHDLFIISEVASSKLHSVLLY